MKFYPYRKGGWKSFSHAEGMSTKRFVVVFMRYLEVLAIKGGHEQCFPVFKVGGHKEFRTCDFPIL